jgi:hypothetical protein
MSGDPDPNLEPTPRKVCLGDFMSEEMLKLAFDIGPKHKFLMEQVVIPNLKEINRKLGQKNDPAYIAYMIVYALELESGLPAKGSRWIGPHGLEIEVVWARGTTVCTILVNAPLAAHDWKTGEQQLPLEDWLRMPLKHVEGT